MGEFSFTFNELKDEAPKPRTQSHEVIRSKTSVNIIGTKSGDKDGDSIQKAKSRATLTPWRPSKKRQKKSRSTDQDGLLRGKDIAAVREAADINLAVRERLSKWPRGVEIIPLLYLLKSEQIGPSYFPSAHKPPIPKMSDNDLGGSKKNRVTKDKFPQISSEPLSNSKSRQKSLASLFGSKEVFKVEPLSPSQSVKKYSAKDGNAIRVEPPSTRRQSVMMGNNIKVEPSSTRRQSAMMNKSASNVYLDAPTCDKHSTLCGTAFSEHHEISLDPPMHSTRTDPLIIPTFRVLPQILANDDQPQISQALSDNADSLPNYKSRLGL